MIARIWTWKLEAIKWVSDPWINVSIFTTPFHDFKLLGEILPSIWCPTKSIGNNARASFVVHRYSLAVSPSVDDVFSPRLSVQLCIPVVRCMIANLLHVFKICEHNALCWLHTHIHTDKFDKMVNQITFWMYSTLCCVVVLAAAQDTCPTEWFTSQFTIVSDRVVDATLGESWNIWWCEWTKRFHKFKYPVWLLQHWCLPPTTNTDSIPVWNPRTTNSNWLFLCQLLPYLPSTAWYWNRCSYLQGYTLQSNGNTTTLRIFCHNCIPPTNTYSWAWQLSHHHTDSLHTVWFR